MAALLKALDLQCEVKLVALLSVASINVHIHKSTWPGGCFFVFFLPTHISVEPFCGFVVTATSQSNSVFSLLLLFLFTSFCSLFTTSSSANATKLRWLWCGRIEPTVNKIQLCEQVSAGESANWMLEKMFSSYSVATISSST